MEFIVGFIVLAVIFFFKPYSSDIKGKWGEMKVAGILSLLPEEDYKIINDVIIQTNGYTSQIDHIVVSIYGIFVIETKNYSGWITGYENSKQWTQNIFGHKNSFYNPIKQNKSHILALKNELYIIEDNFIPIIAFSGNCSLKVETETPIIYISQIYSEIKRHTDIKFDKTQIDGIVGRIKAININSPDMKQQHVAEIRSNVMIEALNVQQGICPKCGAPLVLRKGRYGEFYGCSNYPRCHYTHSDR
ncbi:MAG: NERD domain-containing protein [Alphaproteobacteria bacterium]|nr:NERD domain-containing protein [Alphaproteobacteria bacterium]